MMREPRAARRAAVAVTCLHTGGCSACAQSLAALEAPRYAQRLADAGVTFARVPRHSDIVLLCGALTEQARASVSRLLEGTPRPRALVAVGDCALNGCVFAGSPCLTVPLAQAFAVNVELGGCPPSPQAVIDAISEAKRLLCGQSPLAVVASGATPVESALAALPIAPPALAVSGAAPTPNDPDRAARLGALFTVAGEDWGDDDDLDDDDGGLGDLDTDATPEQTIQKREHLTRMGRGATQPGARQHKEKR